MPDAIRASRGMKAAMVTLVRREPFRASILLPDGRFTWWTLVRSRAFWDALRLRGRNWRDVLSLSGEKGLRRALRYGKPRLWGAAASVSAPSPRLTFSLFILRFWGPPVFAFPATVHRCGQLRVWFCAGVCVPMRRGRHRINVEPLASLRRLQFAMRRSECRAFRARQLLTSVCRVLCEAIGQPHDRSRPLQL